MKVWILLEEEGEYEDHRERVVGVFTDEARVDAIVDARHEEREAVKEDWASSGFDPDAEPDHRLSDEEVVERVTELERLRNEYSSEGPFDVDKWEEPDGQPDATTP